MIRSSRICSQLIGKMSLRSFTLSFPIREYWDKHYYPENLRNQYFADLVEESELLSYAGNWNNQCYLNSGKSSVLNTRDVFYVELSIHDHYQKEELSVKILGDYLAIIANHEEKQDEKHDGHFVSRKCTRRYMLPSDCVRESVSAELNNNVLRIKIPKKPGINVIDVEISSKDDKTSDIPIPEHDKLFDPSFETETSSSRETSMLFTAGQKEKSSETSLRGLDFTMSHSSTDTALPIQPVSCQSKSSASPDEN